MARRAQGFFSWYVSGPGRRDSLFRGYLAIRDNSDMYVTRVRTEYIALKAEWPAWCVYRTINNALKQSRELPESR